MKLHLSSLALNQMEIPRNYTAIFKKFLNYVFQFQSYVLFIDSNFGLLSI